MTDHAPSDVLIHNPQSRKERLIVNPEQERVGEHVTIYLRGQTWWASYQLNRSQQRQSLATSNKKEASRKAVIIAAELQTGTHEIAPPRPSWRRSSTSTSII